jgi:hypothetical protein
MGESRSLLGLEAEIKRRLRIHLRTLGFANTERGDLVPPSQSKEILRGLHFAQRRALLQKEAPFVARQWPALKHHFADGRDIDVPAICPTLELVEANSWQSRLFRLASLTWSIPLSQGYGRRMRFLVWDEAHQALLGLIALGDPVFNLRVRDQWVGWGVEERKRHLVNILDAYVLGAVPPYNDILGGKLVAALVRTRDVRDAFTAKYRHSRGIISGRRKSASLVMVTTASAFGRSSLYNRVRLNGSILYRSLGYTEGWGHFHIPDELFELMRAYLERIGHGYADGFQFGNGPNWKMRAVRKAFECLGIHPGILRHGVRREVFTCELAANARSVLNGTAKTARYDGLQTAAAVGAAARDRWLIPRAGRTDTFRMWRRDAIGTLLSPADDVSFTSITQATGTHGAGQCRSQRAPSEDTSRLLRG